MPASSEADALAQQARFVFKGTVQKLRASTLPDIKDKSGTVIVRVDEIIQAPEELSHFTGHDITVQLSGRKKVKVGEQNVFHTNGWLFGDSIAVVSLRQAVNSVGKIGFLYQQLRGTTAATQRWVRHLRRSSDGISWDDLVLTDTAASTPVRTFFPYIGDYNHLLAVGKDFYGIFSASNFPDQANFPNGVKYQRNANFSTHELFNIDGVTEVPGSIDPFYFKVME